MRPSTYSFCCCTLNKFFSCLLYQINFSSQFSHKFVDTDVLFRTDFAKLKYAQLTCFSFTNRNRNFNVINQIRFVSKQANSDVRICVISYQFNPICSSFKALNLGYIVNDYSSCCISKVNCCYRSELLCPCCVPEL